MVALFGVGALVIIILVIYFVSSRSRNTSRSTSKVAFPDDWVGEHGDWTYRTFCHCGNGYVKESKGNTVCPNCGHIDQWKEGVVRLEYLISPSRKKYADNNHCDYYMSHKSEYIKDEHVVMWTEANCTVPKWPE